MSAVLALVAVLTAADVEITFAPDHPLDYVYVDEPFIVEMISSRAVRGVASLSTGDTADIRELGTLSLQEGLACWKAIDAFPGNRGIYPVNFTLNLDGTLLERSAMVCRIDRPSAGGAMAYGVSLDFFNEAVQQTLAGVSAPLVQLDGRANRIEDYVSAALEAHLQVNVLLDAANDENPSLSAEELAQLLRDRVTRWDIDAGADASRFIDVVQALRRNGANAPVSMVVDNPETLIGLLRGGCGRYAQTAICRGEVDLPTFRGAAERSGYERITLEAVVNDQNDSGLLSGKELVQQILVHFSNGASRVLIENGHLFTAKGFENGYPYMSAMTHRLKSAVYVGSLDVSHGTSAPVFRVGGEWLVALSTTASDQDILLDVGDAGGLRLTDSLNNPLPTPGAGAGGLAVRVSSDPVFLSGSGGTVFAKAAINRARQEAASFLASEGGTSDIPGEYLDAFRSVTASDGTEPVRKDLFALLRLYPWIEAEWHAGRLSRARAVPALAGLHRLVRSLCVVENEHGEPFIESVRDTLDRCIGFQSLYITGSGGAKGARERGDWLLDDVSQLMVESEQLSGSGRAIEAHAIAAAAEWRARALKAAARANPLSLPEPRIETEEEDVSES